MALTRREFQLLQERVGRLESKLYALEQRLSVYENVLKPENLLRRVREGEAEEKRKAEKNEDIFLPPDLGRPH